MANGFKDLTGRRFGWLVVLRRNGTYKDGHHAQWLCRCDCGKEINVRSSDLLSGHSVSCGCKRHNPKKQNDFFDGTRLTSIERVMKRKSSCSNTGYTGVYYDSRQNRYAVSIVSKGITYRKSFHNLNDAIAARAAAVEKYHVPVMEEHKEEYLMDKVLKGRRYNTQTAKKILDSGESALYQKKNGEFFRVDGDKITPLDVAGVREYVNQSPDIDGVEELFTTPDARKQNVKIHLPPDVKRKLQIMAVGIGCTLSEFVETLISREWKNGNYSD